MEADDSVEEWVEEESLPPLARAKILAIKVCRHRCLVYAKNDAALDVATPVIRMLFTYLELQGLISEECNEECVYSLYSKFGIVVDVPEQTHSPVKTSASSF